MPQSTPEVAAAKTAPSSFGTPDSTDSEESPSYRQIKTASRGGLRHETTKSEQTYRDLHNEFIESILFEQLEEIPNKTHNELSIDTTASVVETPKALSGKQQPILTRLTTPQLRYGLSSLKALSQHSEDDSEDHSSADFVESQHLHNKERKASSRSKTRTLLHRLHPSHYTVRLLSSHRTKHDRRVNTHSNLRNKSADKNPRLKPELTVASYIQKCDTQQTPDAHQPSIIRATVTKRKGRKGETANSSSSFTSLESERVSHRKPSTYYLAETVMLYKDRSPNSGEAFYMFDPSDNLNVSAVQGKSAALGKLREKTSLLSSQSSGEGDVKDDFDVVEHRSSLHEAPSLVRQPSLVRASSNPLKGYNFKRTPSGISSFIGHDASSIKVNQGFLPDGLVETRSILKIKIGFLRMNYGILLRWNTSGKIIVIVLKKNTNSAFLKELPIARRLPMQLQAEEASPRISLNSVFNNYPPNCCGTVVGSQSFAPETSVPLGSLDTFTFDWVDCHPNGSCTVVKCCSNGTSETALITAPYLIPQPDPKTTVPPALFVRVISAQLPRIREGAATNFSPIVKFSLGQYHHKTNLGHRSRTSSDDDVITWSNAKVNSATFSVIQQHTSLDVELCDPLKKRHFNTGSFGAGRILLSDLEVSTSEAVPAIVTIMLYADHKNQNVNSGSVTLEVLYIDEMKCWVKAEFQARQKEAASRASRVEKRIDFINPQRSSNTAKIDPEAEYCIIS